MEAAVNISGKHQLTTITSKLSDQPQTWFNVSNLSNQTHEAMLDKGTQYTVNHSYQHGKYFNTTLTV
jgi:hypothetical protein